MEIKKTRDKNANFPILYLSDYTLIVGVHFSNA